MDIHSFSDLVTATWTSALTLVELGGPVVAVQLVISTIGFAMVLYKILQFTGISTGRFRTAERAIDLWGAGDTEQATKLLSKSRLTLARDLQFGLQNLASAEREQLRDELSRRGMFFLRPYGSLLRALEIVYYLSPVLGLVSGCVFLVKAGMLSGMFYLPAAALFLTAPAMALLERYQLPYGISLFGLVSAACFFFPGLKYYREARRYRSDSN